MELPEDVTAEHVDEATGEGGEGEGVCEEHGPYEGGGCAACEAEDYRRDVAELGAWEELGAANDVACCLEDIEAVLQPQVAPGTDVWTEVRSRGARVELRAFVASLAEQGAQGLDNERVELEFSMAWEGRVVTVDTHVHVASGELTAAEALAMAQRLQRASMVARTVRLMATKRLPADVSDRAWVLAVQAFTGEYPEGFDAPQASERAPVVGGGVERVQDAVASVLVERVLAEVPGVAVRMSSPRRGVCRCVVEAPSGGTIVVRTGRNACEAIVAAFEALGELKK